VYLCESQLKLELHYKFEIVMKQISFTLKLEHKYSINKHIKIPIPIRSQNICSTGRIQKEVVNKKTFRIHSIAE
jgi:hypothetical protein